MGMSERRTQRLVFARAGQRTCLRFVKDEALWTMFHPRNAEADTLASVCDVVCELKSIGFRLVQKETMDGSAGDLLTACRFERCGDAE